MQTLSRRFEATFGSKPMVVRSPGRINLLGEHTDYNQGFVLPAAIDKYAYVAIGPRTDNRISLLAVDLNENFETSISDIAPVSQTWCNYILGVASQFARCGLLDKGFNLAVSSEIPAGAGLSSSAAISCATAFALNELLHGGIDRLELAKFAQAAEHSFAGVQCGIMDQFASLFGKKDAVIHLDCRSMDYRYIPLKLNGYELLLFNSGVKHSLASTAYNDRRRECEEGVRLIARCYPEVKSLRDATPAQVDECVSGYEIVHRRCRYVVEENIRVLLACDDLQTGNLRAFGQRMTQTHIGLQHQYEVSCRETDFLVAKAISTEGVAGARMMGGGFGGCTLNLVQANAAERLIDKLKSEYARFTGKDLACYRVSTVNGTEVAQKT